MGNVCSSCVCRQTDEDEAADALLNGFDPPSSRPRGPPPPYQVQAPLYAMTEEQRVQLVQRVTMIQSLPLGRYDVGEDKAEKEEKLEFSEEVQGREKKGVEERECPICMNDFVVGEPIRLLPCMHFYHMRCIDNWLMRSYSCPSCMERVDVGMRHTLSSTMPTSPAPSLQGVRRRRRRGRGERGSTSSLASLLSMGEGSVAAGGKRRVFVGSVDEGDFPPPEYAHHSGQTARASGQSAPLPGQSYGASGHPTPGHTPQHSYLTNQSTIPGHHYRHNSGQSTATGHTGYSEQVEGASGGFDPEEVRVLNDGGFIVRARTPSQDDIAYSMDTMTFSDYQPSSVSSRGGEYFPPGPQSPHPRSPTSDDGRMMGVPGCSSPRGVGPFSPPVFEYHFEFPPTGPVQSASYNQQ